MKYVGIFIVAVLIAGVAITILYEEPETILKQKNAATHLSVDVLFNSFTDNEEIANREFLQKEIFIRGRLTAINPLLNSQTILKLEGNTKGTIHCLFDTKNLYEKIDDLKLNSEIILKGECIGFMDEVYLSNCRLLSVKNTN